MYNWIHTVAVVVQVLSALGVILLVLLQHGKGADMGAAFGSGASGSLFGATGSANFLSRSTGVLAALFLVSTLGLAFLSNDRPRGSESLMQGVVPSGPASEIPASRPPQAPADVPSVPATGGSSSAPAGGGSSSVPPMPSSGVSPGQSGSAVSPGTSSGVPSVSPGAPASTGTSPATPGAGSNQIPK